MEKSAHLLYRTILVLLVISAALLGNSCAQSDQSAREASSFATDLPGRDGFAGLVANGDYNAAIGYYYDYIYGNSMLELEAEECLLEYFPQVINKVFSGECQEKEAQAAFQTVDRISAETGAALSHIQEFQDDLEAALASKTAFASGTQLQDAENYLAAFAEYQKVLEPDINYPQAKSAAENCLSLAKAAALEEAKEKADGNQYAEAISILNLLSDNMLTPDNQVSSQIAVYEQMLVKTALEEAEAVFSTPASDYRDALNIIYSALQQLPESEELNAKKDYYTAFEPVNLYTLSPYKGALETRDTDTDILGNTYQNCFGYQPGWYASADSATYDIATRFNTLTAKLYGMDDIDRTCYYTLLIYGDEMLVYENREIPGNGKPFEITVDITGITDLRIEMCCSSQDNRYLGFGMTDVLLQRTVK